MQYKMYQVDAFTDKPFAGNPAAIVPLTEWLPDHLMQSIAMENNIAETAFYVPQGEDFHLRWFTPTVEVELCGHATLASAFLLLNHLEPERESVTFHTRSGPLLVTRNGEGFTMDLPVVEPHPIDLPDGFVEAIGREPVEMLAGRKAMAVFDDPVFIRDMMPDLLYIAGLEQDGLIITSPGEDGGPYDFISRYFAPAGGIPEDPVTGSAHVTTAPYWSRKLGKQELNAFQASPRGGAVLCRMGDGRVFMSGQAVLFMEGTINV